MDNQSTVSGETRNLFNSYPQIQIIIFSTTIESNITHHPPNELNWDTEAIRGIILVLRTVNQIPKIPIIKILFLASKDSSELTIDKHGRTNLEGVKGSCQTAEGSRKESQEGWSCTKNDGVPAKETRYIGDTNIQVQDESLGVFSKQRIPTLDRSMRWKERLGQLKQ